MEALVLAGWIVDQEGLLVRGGVAGSGGLQEGITGCGWLADSVNILRRLKTDDFNDDATHRGSGSEHLGVFSFGPNLGFAAVLPRTAMVCLRWKGRTESQIPGREE